MSARHHYTILCDHGGCTSRYGALEPRAARVRAMAALRGWTTRLSTNQTRSRTSMLDLCPRHGTRLSTWRPPAEMTDHDCLCDARGQGTCMRHLPEHLWRRALDAAAAALSTDAVNPVAEVVATAPVGVSHAAAVIAWLKSGEV